MGAACTRGLHEYGGSMRGLLVEGYGGACGGNEATEGAKVSGRARGTGIGSTRET